MDRGLVPLYDLAWLRQQQGNIHGAIESLERYVREDDDPDEFTCHVKGVLGHWKWCFLNDREAEPLLRDGADHYESARADLASLLKATERLSEAIEVLQTGVDQGEVDSFLPLANIYEEDGRYGLAEELFRRGFELGDAFSAFKLHRMLVSLDRESEAADWLWKAAQGGDELAIKKLSKRADDDPLTAQ